MFWLLQPATMEKQKRRTKTAALWTFIQGKGREGKCKWRLANCCHRLQIEKPTMASCHPPPPRRALSAMIVPLGRGLWATSSPTWGPPDRRPRQPGVCSHVFRWAHNGARHRAHFTDFIRDLTTVDSNDQWGTLSVT